MMTNDRIVDTLNKLKGLRSEYHDAIVSALGGPKVALKRWVASHDVLETLQVTYDDIGRPIRAWWPGPREVDTSAASHVRLGGSRRDYRGVTCLGSSRDAWVGQDDSGTLLIYTTL